MKVNEVRNSPKEAFLIAEEWFWERDLRLFHNPI
jgi:hypothetical protein